MCTRRLFSIVCYICGRKVHQFGRVLYGRSAPMCCRRAVGVRNSSQPYPRTHIFLYIQVQKQISGLTKPKSRHKNIERFRGNKLVVFTSNRSSLFDVCIQVTHVYSCSSSSPCFLWQSWAMKLTGAQLCMGSICII